MGEETTDLETGERRTLLKGLGLGCLALPLLASDGIGASETNAASPQKDQSNQLTPSLTVTKVEPGWMRADGGWDAADPPIDMGTAFDVNISVEGIEPSGNTSLAYLVVPTGPDDTFTVAKSGTATNPPSGGTAQIAHGSPITRGFHPTPESHNWTNGTYQLSAIVLDRTRQAFGGRVSDPFTIR